MEERIWKEEKEEEEEEEEERKKNRGPDRVGRRKLRSKRKSQMWKEEEKNRGRGRLKCGRRTGTRVLNTRFPCGFFSTLTSHHMQFEP